VDRPLREAPRPAAPATPPAADVAAATGSAAEPRGIVETIRGGAAAMGPSAPAPTPAPATPAPREPEPRQAPPATARLAPKAHLEVEPKHPAVPREPDERGRPVDLATHVPGLQPLPVRCPGSEDVELAVDAEGRVHLLGGESALRRLPVVRRWAFEHRELIAMACPRHRIELREPPALHLFTGTPVSLADLHASDVQLHVLAPVRVGGAVGWYSAELNRI
jgi:hypothetical protein